MKFLTKTRLARRLLSRPLKLVNDIVFFALVIYSVGCVIPTTLDQQSGTDYPPIIVRGTPAFGSYTFSRSQTWSWSVTATDYNREDQLTLRLLSCTDSGCQPESSDLVMMSSPTTDPVQALNRVAQTETRAFCAQKQAGTYQIRAIVSDRGFLGQASTSDVAAGPSNERDWEETCD